jgi:hypothetical protein
MRGTIDNTEPETPVFAIVEQMGHRRFGARIKEVTRFGAKCMEATVLGPKPITTYVFGHSLFAVTLCTEEQARRANVYHTGLPLLESGPSEDIPFDDGPPVDRCGECHALEGDPHEAGCSNVTCGDCGASLGGEHDADCPRGAASAAEVCSCNDAQHQERRDECDPRCNPDNGGHAAGCPRAAPIDRAVATTLNPYAGRVVRE